jgi:RNA polymerase sigma factor (sigma-70 family)
MATAQMSRFLRRLTRGMAAETLGELTDRQLLERLLAARDQAVFEALVRRHGPMVYRVCWRVLQQAEDTEDAFQATFLLLARRLETVRKRDSLASWLHGVAHRVALDAKAQAARRRRHEARAADNSHPGPPEEITWGELRTVLDAELGRLPEKWRLPLILCYLEGRSQEEAATHLGWSKSTLLRRLEEARAALGRRLTRRGVVWPAALSAVLLSDCVAPAALAPRLVSSTVEAAASIATGQAALPAVVSAKVAALTEGVVNAMFASKVKIAAAMLLLVGALSAGIWFLGTGGPAIQGQEPKQSSEAAKKSPEKPTQSSEDAKDKPKPEVKPVAVTEKAAINRLDWDAKGETVVTVGFTFEVAERAGPNGQNPQKVLVPNSTIKLWDATTGELKRSLGEEKGILIRALALSPDRKTAVVTTIKFTDENGKPLGGSRGTEEVRLMDAEKWELKRKVDSDGVDGLFTNYFLVYAVAFSPDGKTLAMGGASPRVEGGCFLKLWDVQKEKLIGGTKETREAEVGSDLGEAVTSLAFSPDGKLLAAGCMDGKLRLFDGRTGEFKTVWDDDSARAAWIVFSPDGKTLVSQSRDKTVKVWDVETAKVLRTLQGNKGWFLAAAFSPDGKLFATGGIVRENDKVTGGEVILWDAQTGDLKHTLPDQTMPVSTLSFSPDGKTLAVAGGSGGDLKDDGKTTGEIKLFPLESLKKAEPK